MEQAENIQKANKAYFEQFGIQHFHTHNNLGQGVKVALLDSKIPDSSLEPYVTQTHFVPKNFSINEKHTHPAHGLFMTSLLHAIAPKADIHLHAVHTDFIVDYRKHITDDQYYINALNTCIDDSSVHIINLSWSPKTFATCYQQIHSSDKLVVLAAGNLKLELNDKRKDLMLLIERLPNLIIVGAHDLSRRRWTKSNYPGIDRNGQYLLKRDAIPSDKICSLDPHFTYAPGKNIVGQINASEQASWNGTSLAAIFVSGLACLMKGGETSLTPHQLKSRIL